MRLHSVKKGETCKGIAEHYGISLSFLAEQNGKAPDEAVHEGEVLWIRRPWKTCRAEAGDTVEGIAKRYRLSPLQLYRNNPHLCTEALREGEELVLLYPTPPYGSISVNGYAFPHIREECLKKALPYLTYLSVYATQVLPNGTIQSPDADKCIAQAKAQGVLPLLVFASRGASGGYQREIARKIVSDMEYQEDVLRQISRILKKDGYCGLVLDLQYMPEECKEGYTAFAARLKELLSCGGMLLFCNAAPWEEKGEGESLACGQDISELGKHADALLPMTYMWGSTYSPPMPVAPIDKISSVCRELVRQTNAQKIFLGIPNFGYCWEIPYRRGSRAMPLSPKELRALSQACPAPIRRDRQGGVPYLCFSDENSKQNQKIIYFDDADSLYQKLLQVHAYRLGGVSIWNIMEENPQLWTLLHSMFRIVKGYPLTPCMKKLPQE